MKVRGFIFQASYRTGSGPTGARAPVVYVYGKLEDGGTFLVRDDRQRPQFYIRAEQAAAARALGAPPPQPTERRTFDGAPVCALETASPADIPAVRDRLHQA